MLTEPITESWQEMGCGFVNAPIHSRDARSCRVIRDLTLLFEISRTLEESLDLHRVIRRALKRMVASMGLLRGTVVVANGHKEELVESEAGEHATIPDEEAPAAPNLLKWVMETGKPLTVANIALDENFHDSRLFPDQSDPKAVIAFLCVPIRSGRRTLGTLSVKRQTRAGISLDREVRMLMIIASVLAQAVSLRQLAE